MKALVDRDLCISCGLCESICGAVFELDDENIAAPLVDEIPKDQLTGAKKAEKQCPVKAIVLE